MWHIKYYNEKVIQWIDKMPVGIRAVYARITERMIAFGPNLGMPYTRAMGKGLFEIRAKGREGIARIFYCSVIDQEILILHGFIKKTQKTPKKELEVARKRMKEVKDENTRRHG